MGCNGTYILSWFLCSHKVVHAHLGFFILPPPPPLVPVGIFIRGWGGFYFFWKVKLVFSSYFPIPRCPWSHQQTQPRTLTPPCRPLWGGRCFPLMVPFYRIFPNSCPQIWVCSGFGCLGWGICANGGSLPLEVLSFPPKSFSTPAPPTPFLRGGGFFKVYALGGLRPFLPWTLDHIWGRYAATGHHWQPP